MRRVTSGGGWAAVWYTLRMASRVGWGRLWTAMRRKNACKTCALGMGGQMGGMVNEGGHFPEVCKKSFQAMVSDMQAGIRPEFFGRYSLEALRTLTPRELEMSGRLVNPVIARPGDTHYSPITWDEALQRVAAQLADSGPERSFFYASGRSSMEAGFLFQLFARLFGTNYVNNCSYYCHQASGVALNRALGTGTASLSLDDLEHADFFMLIGGNPASNHPRLLRTLMQIRRAGGEVVVVNPVKEVGLVNFRVPSDVRSLLFGSPIASLYVQPHIGGDIAFLAGVAKELLAGGHVDAGFIDSVTQGFAEFRAAVEAMPWPALEAQSGIARATMAEVARRYARAKNAVFGWTMGITHHVHGVENVHMIVNLALLRGMVGRPRAGLLPIRGHSNVQGMGSIGVTPTLKKAVLERVEARLGVTLPKAPGLDTMACMEAAARGPMRTALCLGGNLFGSNPDANFAARALGKLEQIVYLSTTLNTGHAWGLAKETIILPVLPRDEEDQPTTQESMFNFVRVSDGGPRRYPGPRSEVSILCHLGEAVLGSGGPVDWRALASHDAIRRLIAEVIPGLEPLADVGQTKAEFHIPGRLLHQPRFGTPTGKAHFQAVALPELPALGPKELRLMTIRSEGQFNTVVYEEEDLYRGQERRDVILMHADDLRRLGLRENERVTVRSSVGSLSGYLARRFDITPGNALMYFPEANVLVPTTVDPQSKTPAFKHVLVTVEPWTAPAAAPAASPTSARRSLDLVQAATPPTA